MELPDGGAEAWGVLPASGTGIERASGEPPSYGGDCEVACAKGEALSMAEQLTFFSSLDFPGRTTLMVWEIAKRLGCSDKHVFNEIDAQELVTLDLKNKGSGRRMARVPIECYRDYVLKRLTGPQDMRMRFLTDLPAATRRVLIIELQASLRAKP